MSVVLTCFFTMLPFICFPFTCIFAAFGLRKNSRIIFRLKMPHIRAVMNILITLPHEPKPCHFKGLANVSFHFQITIIVI